MKLEEAQRRAQQMRGWAEVKKEISDTGQALVVLDDRITELEGKLKIKHGLLEDCQKWMDYHNERADKAEAQRDELETIVIELGGVGALPTTVYASDKEDKG